MANPACPEFGFFVHIRPASGRAAADVSAALDDFARMLAENGLYSQRDDQRALDQVVVREGMQATDADRQLVRDWAAGWTNAVDVVISDLIDLR
jgi:uncharacterized protein YggL (DUF469 family)